MTFGSWSFDNRLIDYYPRHFKNGPIGLANFLENDAWSVLVTHGEFKTVGFRIIFSSYKEVKYILYLVLESLKS